MAASILEGPALQAPPGVESNFINPHSLEHADIAVLAISVIIPTIVLGLRVYSKVFILKKLGADDYVLMTAWALYMAYCALTFELVYEGVARHMWDIRLIELISMLYKLYIELILYNIITLLVKTSILLQFLSIFCPPKKRNAFFWSCWGLIGFICSFYFAATVASICACSPREKFWNPWMTEGHCINIDETNIASGAVNSAADLIIIILPQSSIWRLQMPLSKKIKASGIFFLGLFALACSLARLYNLVKVMTLPDKTWHLNIMGLWTSAELITTFICSCLPSLAQLTNHWKPAVTKLVQKSYRSESGSSQQTLKRSISSESTIDERYIHGEKPDVMKSSDSYTFTRSYDTRNYVDRHSDEESTAYDPKNQI